MNTQANSNVNQGINIIQKAQDIAKTKEFIENPSSFSVFKYNDSTNVAQVFIDGANSYACYTGMESQEKQVNMELFGAYLYENFGEEIIEYYKQNGVQFESEEHEENALKNTTYFMAYSADIDVDGNVSTEELRTIIDEMDRHENWDTNIIAKTGENAISQEGLEAMFNILTTGEMDFVNYNQEEHEAKMIEMLKAGTFYEDIDTTYLESDDIRMTAGAKYREGYELYDEDVEALVKLLDYNHYVAIRFWGYDKN